MNNRIDENNHAQADAWPFMTVQNLASPDTL